ncbi:hypothetical protein Droror1_Dr00019144 [Drosera rotundifolia]
MSTSSRVSQFSDLFQRVTASCLLHPLGSSRFTIQNNNDEDSPSLHSSSSDEDEDEVDSTPTTNPNPHTTTTTTTNNNEEQLIHLLSEVFSSASRMRRSYAGLQMAMSPWDAERVREADAEVVTEMRRIGELKERFRRREARNMGERVGVGMGRAREVVEPYERVAEELRREVREKEREVERLRETVRGLVDGGGAHGSEQRRWKGRRRVGSIEAQVSVSPSPDLFEAAMSQVTVASKSFTSLLLSLMRSTHWDIAAAVRSIVTASTTATNGSLSPISPTTPAATSHAKYALESYVSRKIFQGFDHETFYMDGTLSSLLNPDQFRRECFSKYRDMKSMDPAELLGILPTCQFGVFCNKRYLSIIHPKMEESLFGNLEQHRQVMAGNHPRTEFYGEFLRLAKAVWLLHLLAFALDPPPSHFEASPGAEFHPGYMESAVRFQGGMVPPGLVVGFSISPGFRFGRGSVIKTRVYLVPKT